MPADIGTNLTYNHEIINTHTHANTFSVFTSHADISLSIKNYKTLKQRMLKSNKESEFIQKCANRKQKQVGHARALKEIGTLEGRLLKSKSNFLFLSASF